VTVLRGILLIALLLIHSSPLVGAGCAITPDANGLVTIPASQTSIADNAFYQCGTLKTVSFPADSLCTTIGSNAFNGCTLLATVSFEADSALTTIAGAAWGPPAGIADARSARRALTPDLLGHLSAPRVLLGSPAGVSCWGWGRRAEGRGAVLSQQVYAERDAARAERPLSRLGDDERVGPQEGSCSPRCRGDVARASRQE